MIDRANTSGEAGISVLVCDDNQPIRVLLAAVVSTRQSLRIVGEAADGNEAIAEAERLQPDVILLDLAMPNRTGLEALPELARVAPAAKIIVFSGFSAPSVAEDVIEAAAALRTPDTLATPSTVR